MIARAATTPAKEAVATSPVPWPLWEDSRCCRTEEFAHPMRKEGIGFRGQREHPAVTHCAELIGEKRRDIRRPLVETRIRQPQPATRSDTAPLLMFYELTP